MQEQTNNPLQLSPPLAWNEAFVVDWHASRRVAEGWCEEPSAPVQNCEPRAARRRSQDGFGGRAGVGVARELSKNSGHERLSTPVFSFPSSPPVTLGLGGLSYQLLLQLSGFGHRVTGARRKSFVSSRSSKLCIN
jgi:hypothetical protein